MENNENLHVPGPDVDGGSPAHDIHTIEPPTISDEVHKASQASRRKVWIMVGMGVVILCVMVYSGATVFMNQNGGAAGSAGSVRVADGGGPRPEKGVLATNPEIKSVITAKEKEHLDEGAKIGKVALANPNVGSGGSAAESFDKDSTEPTDSTTKPVTMNAITPPNPGVGAGGNYNASADEAEMAKEVAKQRWLRLKAFMADAIFVAPMVPAEDMANATAQRAVADARGAQLAQVASQPASVGPNLATTGERWYGVMLSAHSTNVPQTPALAEVVSETYKGGQFTGKVTPVDDTYIVAEFTSLCFAKKCYQVDAIALDPKTYEAALSDSVDDPRLMQSLLKGTLAAGKTYGEAMREEGSTSIQNNSGIGLSSTSSQPVRSASTRNKIAAGAMAESLLGDVEAAGAAMKKVGHTTQYREVVIVFRTPFNPSRDIR